MVNPNAPLVPQELRGLLHKELNPAERLADLFSGKDDRADLQISLLYAILRALVGEEPAPGETAPAGLNVQMVLDVNQEDVMRNISALTTDEIPPTKMADCRYALRTILVVNNNFDQQVSVSIIGNGSQAHDSAYEIHSMNVAAGAKGSYGIKNEEWFPYIGCKITPAGNPTTGTVSASVIKLVQG